MIKNVVDFLDVNKNILKILEFTKLAKISVSIIRYWMKIGKLKPATFTQSGYALFNKEQIKG